MVAWIPITITAANGDKLVSVSAPGTAIAGRITGGSVHLPPQPGEAAAHPMADARGTVTTFTIDLRAHPAGKQGWNVQPFGPTRHASLATMSPELAAQSYAVLINPRGFSPKAQIDIDGVKTVLDLRSRYGEPKKTIKQLLSEQGVAVRAFARFQVGQAG